MNLLNPCNIYSHCYGSIGSRTTTNMGCLNFYSDPELGCVDVSGLIDFTNNHYADLHVD